MFFHERLHCLKIPLSKPVLHDDLSEFAQGGSIWDALFQKVQMHEFPHGIAVVDRIFQRFIGKIVPSLEQIHPKHRFDPACLPPFLVVVVVRLNHSHYFIPRRDLIHALKKLFPLGLTLAIAVLYICEIRLTFHDLTPNLFYQRFWAQSSINHCLPKN